MIGTPPASFCNASAFCANVGVEGSCHSTCTRLASTHSSVRNRSAIPITQPSAPPISAFFRSIVLTSCASSARIAPRSEEHTSELQSRGHLVCRLLLEKQNIHTPYPQQS